MSNPYAPGAGSPPPELAGREKIINQALVALERIRLGRSEKSMFMVGLRGVGKTVLLVEIQKLAQEKGYKVAFIEAHESRHKKSLAEILVPHLRRILFSLDRGDRVSEHSKRALRVFKSFLHGLRFKLHDLELSLDWDAETGTADSGDLEVDLAELFVAIGEAAKDRGTAVAIIVDELQYIDEIELSALIMAVHRVSQKSLPLIVIGAGLPQLVGKSGNSKSYAERLFSYPVVGPLEKKDAIIALAQPAQQGHVTFHDDALDEIYRVTHGYPYFLQEWGYHVWNMAPQSPITLQDVMRATPQALHNLDESFFRVRFDRLTPTEKKYVRALADLGSTPQRSGDIAEKLGVPVSRVAPLRAQLIGKGMIYSPSHGETAFTVPLFEEFLQRAIPIFSQ